VQPHFAGSSSNPKQLADLGVRESLDFLQHEHQSQVVRKSSESAFEVPANFGRCGRSRLLTGEIESDLMPASAAPNAVEGEPCCHGAQPGSEAASLGVAANRHWQTHEQILHDILRIDGRSGYATREIQERTCVPVEEGIQRVQITGRQAPYERRIVGAFVREWNRRLWCWHSSL